MHRWNPRRTIASLSWDDSMVKPTDEQIRQRAHELWQEAGRPEGQQDQFWFEAERELTRPDTALNPDEKSGTFTE
jgi:hypothetical protein